VPSPPLDFSPYRIHNGLAVYRFGRGSPIFLMPGPHRFQRPGYRTADALINGFVRLGYQVITFDPPGSGYSTRPARISMAEMHRCSQEALEVCQVFEPVGGVGHSMGGLALLAYAIDCPARFNRLALIGIQSTGTDRDRFGWACLYERARGAVESRPPCFLACGHAGYFAYGLALPGPGENQS